MLELFDKSFKAVIKTMFQQEILNTLEINGIIESLGNIYTHTQITI